MRVHEYINKQTPVNLTKQLSAKGYTSIGKGIDAIVFAKKTGDVIKSYNFVGLFPVDISPIDLDWGSNDSIEEYSVTFAYQYWNSNTTS